MSFRLAELFVDITAKTESMDRGLARVKSTLSATLSGMGSLAAKGAGAVFSAFSSAARLAGAALKTALIGAGLAIAAGTAYAINAASNLNETVSKTGVVFGESSGQVMRAAQEMADAFGIPKQEFLDAASMFGLIATGMGKTKDQAASLAVHFARLAADTASFHNIPVADALEKIRAGLTGESEPLKALGVLMDEDATKAYAVANGLAKKGQELTNAVKLEARAAIITRGLATANGDLARTADGVANRLRELGGRFQNLAADLGQFLLPAVKRITGEFADAMKLFEGFVRDNEATFTAWGASLEGAIGIGASAWKHWREALNIANEFAKEKATNILEVFQNLAANFPPLMDRIKDAIINGFEEAWKQTKKINQDQARGVVGGLIRTVGAPGALGLMSHAADAVFGKAPPQVTPRGKPRDFVPLALSSNPALGAALSTFGGLHKQDEDLRNAQSLDDIVAEGMKRGIAEGFKQADNSTLRGRRGQSEPDPKMTGDFREHSNFYRGAWLGRANNTLPLTQALQKPPAQVAAAMLPKTKGGVTDADAYARELTEGALKGADVAKEQLETQKSMDASLKKLADGPKFGGYATTTWN